MPPDGGSGIIAWQLHLAFAGCVVILRIAIAIAQDLRIIDGEPVLRLRRPQDDKNPAA